MKKIIAIVILSIMMFVGGFVAGKLINIPQLPGHIATIINDDSNGVIMCTFDGKEVKLSGVIDA